VTLNPFELTHLVHMGNMRTYKPMYNCIKRHTDTPACLVLLTPCFWWFALVIFANYFTAKLMAIKWFHLCGPVCSQSTTYCQF